MPRNTTTVAAAASLFTYIPPAPAPRSNRAPGEMWIEAADPGRYGSGTSYVVKRVDVDGWEYDWLYLAPGDLEKFSKAALSVLVKRAHDSG